MVARDPKKIPDEPLDGTAGIGVIQTIVGRMHHHFQAYGQPEVGIDGAIELRDPRTHAMTGRVLFVQSKAHARQFDNETPESFTFTVDRRDLDYWMDVSGPVLLIISRPEVPDAYWLAVQEFFADPDRRESRTAVFDKSANAFTAASTDDLFAVFRRDEARRAEALQSLVRGPLDVLGMSDELQAAQHAEAEGDLGTAAPIWLQLAEAVGNRLSAPFVWPLLERAAIAQRESGERPAAVELYKRLARERLAADDPSADFDVQRALINGANDDDFEFALLWIRATAPEQGIEALEDLRHLHTHAKGAAQRRQAASALVDALVLYGCWEEAVAVADKIALKRLNSPEKRALLADRCDAAGELGHDVNEDWDRLLVAAQDAGPWPYAIALQRRAVFLIRRQDTVGAEDAFRRAADVWARVPGAEDQAAEALLSMESCAGMTGHQAGVLPFGTRAAAALTRGVASVPVVRADRLALTGLAYLADNRYPDALKHLTLALMVERRAGDLFGLRRMLLFVGRVYEAVDEPAQALRWWIRAGDERRAEGAASGLTFGDVRSRLHLDTGPPWERSASFAALSVIAKNLTVEDVADVAAATVASATPPPHFVAPQPSFYARKVLAVVAEHLPDEHVAAAEAILREEVEAEGFTAGEAAGALLKLTRRGVIDAVPFVFDMLMTGRQLPVTVAGFLKTAPKRQQRRVVKAAVAGNTVALAEAARAELPEAYPELRPLCREKVRAAIQSEATDAHVEHIGVSFGDIGDLGRHCPRPTQGQLTDLLLRVVSSDRYDPVSKISALIALAVLAPGLPKATAARALDALLPVAAGALPPSAPGVMRDHPNPKRARNVLRRDAQTNQLQACAIQACGRLAHRGVPKSTSLAGVLDQVLVQGEETLVRMALRELISLPDLPLSYDAASFVDDPRSEVAEAAKALVYQREHGHPPTGYS